MQYELPTPISCGILGSLAGLAGGGCNQCFPVWVGAATGGSLGCAICICMMFIPKPVEPVTTTTEPVIINNTYVAYLSGESKDISIVKVNPNKS